MKNKLLDLNNHLFAQLERLSDESIDNDQLAIEMERTKAITSVAKEIISNASLVLDAHKAVGDHLIRKMPAMLEADK